MSVVKRAVRHTLRAPAARTVALKLAAVRNRGLILCYHHVSPEPRPDAATPTLSTSDLRSHVEVLAELGDIVTTDELLADQFRRRPAFVLTFDDDYESHVTEVLPVLAGAGVGATFFLSGRHLSGLGAYWWERLDAAVDRVGFESVRRHLDLPAESPRTLALAAEGTDRIGRLLDVDEPSAGLSDEGMRVLRDANMTIGFHTLHHDVLPALADHELASAVSAGRSELEQVLGGDPIRYFSYPHGNATSREAAAVQAAGYQAGFTTSWSPYAPNVDRWRIGRWVPEGLAVDEFAGRVALRLNAGTAAAR